MLAVSVAISADKAGDYSTQLLDLTVAQLELWHARHLNQRLEHDFKSAAAIVELVTQIERAPTLSLACHSVVNELRDFLSCDRVALALKRQTMAGCQLTTISGLADFDPRSESAQAFQSAADESAIRGSLGTWPILSGDSHQATVGVLCLPLPYNVSASCTLEPVLRRIVCAPYDGLLEESLVEAGTLVERDAMLARMDAREIRWELASVVAERHQALKDFDRNLSAGEITKAQLAQLDGQRLGKKVELLEAREENHELRAPVEGIVLKGSVERSSSAPVKLGQPLFEVAQLHPLRLEIEVPATDYLHVRPGQSVEITLDGISDRTVIGTVEKIRPRSEI